MNTVLNKIKNNDLYWAFLVLSFFSIFGAVLLKTPALMALPLVIVGAYFILLDFRRLFYLLILTIPLSTEMSIGGGVGIDFPSEPIMLTVTGLFLFVFILKPHLIDLQFLKHPFVFLLFLHWIWIFHCLLFCE